MKNQMRAISTDVEGHELKPSNFRTAALLRAAP
jgi:hypothetical protein